jgi:hypothetical protein
MQVVVPSVSLADVLQRTAFTIFVEIPSSATLSKPVAVPGSNGLLTGGARSAVGTVADGVVAGGDPIDPPVAPGVCCANAAEEKSARAVARINLRKRIEPSLVLEQRIDDLPGGQSPISWQAAKPSFPAINPARHLS